MPSRLTLTIAVLALATASFAQSKHMKKMAAAPAPDNAYLQKIWDGWSTLDPANVAQYYATGPHTFFDIAPLKYSSWDEYRAGVKNVLADYKAATCTVNDDAELHPAGEYVWGDATVKCDMTHQSGKLEIDTFRWTYIFQKENGKWLIVHEHVSESLS
jgi:ketosteroid isomerase-like protein